MSNFPTLDGLNNIDVDNGNLTNITCETFIATLSAQVPTVLPGSNDNNVANTEFVTDAVSTATANLVTTNTSQTIALGAVKTFLTLPQSSATVSNNEDLVTKKYVDDNFINIIGDQTLTTGTKIFTVLPQSSAIPSSNADFTTKKYTDDNFVGLTGAQTISGVKTFNSLPQSSISPSNNSDLINKLYLDNIISGLTGSYVSLATTQTITGNKTFNSLPQCSATVSNNSDLVNKLYVDNIFSGVTGATGGAFVTLAGDQTLTTGTKIFTNLPQSSAIPGNNADLVNKLYVDNLFSGATGPTGAFVTLAGDQTLTTGTKIFTNLPQSSASPSNNSDLVNKLYIDNIVSGLTGTYITLGTAQTITATKTFSALPQSSLSPSNNHDLVNKLYVDNAVSGITGSFVTLAGNQVLSAGIKTFTDLPECTAIPSNNATLTNKSYVDNNFLNLVGNQTVSSGTVKTFLTLPQSSAVPSVNQDMVNKLYVDNAVSGVVGATGTFLTLSGNQTVSSGTIKTFLTLPQSTAIPSANSDLVNKLYVDSSFVNLSGSQTITGNKTFTGNNIFHPTSGTTIIRGAQADIFADVTFLTGTTTTISGTYGNFQSTNNYIAGTTTTLASTNMIVNNTVNSFYIDASYNNFVGKETYINTPYFLINSNCLYFDCRPAQTIIRSPYVAFTNACTSLNINATNTFITGNTDMTGSVVTATTQASSDNSTKIATTAFVNAHTLANYMTTNTNQNVSGIKTYSTKQVFNAGTACNTYDATGITDMTLGSNMTNGILDIDAGRIICDTFGVRVLPNGGNLQLNGTFIQPNPSLGAGEIPLLNFPNNQTGNFSNVPLVSGQGEATKQINITILKFWCGNNQSSVFTLTHSLTNGYAVGPGAWAEDIITISFVDANTGITRYTTPNYATTGAFSMSPFGTVIRPNIVFTLDTTILPQAVYNIFAYVKVSNGFINQALNTMTWNLGTLPYVTTQNYNTPIDYTFTSRNLYHCFRNTAMCGVFLLNSVTGSQHIPTPIHYSISDFNNMMFQPTTSGAVSTPAVTGGSAVGNFSGLAVDNADNRYLVYPNYSLILYDNTGWSGTVYINYKNTTSNPVCIAPTTTQRGSSCRIYFDEVELIKY